MERFIYEDAIQINKNSKQYKHTKSMASLHIQTQLFILLDFIAFHTLDTRHVTAQLVHRIRCLNLLILIRN